MAMVRSVLRVEHLIDRVTREIVAKADGNPLFLEQLALHAGEARDLRTGARGAGDDPRCGHGAHRPVAGGDKAAAADRRRHRPRIPAAPFERGLARETRRPKTILRELARLEFVYGARRARRPGLRLPPRADPGDCLWQPARAPSPHPSRRCRARPRSGSTPSRAHEVAELLALHFGRSDEAEKAVDYAIVAAEKSQRRWANSEAVAISTMRCARLERCPTRAPNRLRRIDAVIKQAEVKFALGRAHRAHRGAGPHPRADRRRARRPAPPCRLALLDRVFAQPDRRRAGNRDRPLPGSGDARRGCRSRRDQGFCRILPFPGLHDHRPAARRDRGRRTGARELRGARQSLVGRADALVLDVPTRITSGNGNAASTIAAAGSRTANALNDLRLKAVGWTRIGLAHIQQGDVERGLECCEEALRVFADPSRCGVRQGGPRAREHQGGPARLPESQS